MANTYGFTFNPFTSNFDEILLTVDVPSVTGGVPNTYAGFDNTGTLFNVPGISFVDAPPLWRGEVFNKALDLSVTDAQAIVIQSDLDGQTAGNFNGVNVTTNYGGTTATAINFITPFGVYGQVGAFANIQNLTAFQDNTQLIDGAKMVDQNSFVASPRINSAAASINSYGALRCFANIGDVEPTTMNGVAGIQMGANFGQFSNVNNVRSISSEEFFQTGSQLSGYTGFATNPQFNVATMNSYRAAQLNANFAQASATAVNNHIDIEINPNYQTGSSLQQYLGIAVSPNFHAGSDTSALSGTGMQQNMQIDSSVVQNMVGIASYGNFGTSHALAMNQYQDLTLNPHFGSGLTLANYYAMSVRQNVDAGATVTGNVQLMSLGANGPLPVAGNAQGIQIDMSNYQTPAMPTGLQVNSGGSQLNANFDTGIYSVQSGGGPYGLNNIGGQFHVAAGHPITGGNFGIGNNLGIGILIEDNVPADSTGLDLGFVMNGFLTQIGVAAGKSMSSLTFMGAGAQNAFGATGTFDEINMFRAIGILPGAGAVISNIYGFKVDSLLSAASPTNAWGVWVGDTNADNWFAKDVVIGGSTGKPTGAYALDITGNSSLYGSLRLADTTGSGFASTVSAPTLIADTTFTLPPTNGTSGYVLQTDGAGNTSWVAAPSTGVTSVTASGPLASSGGATPNISLTGVVDETHGGTNQSTYATGDMLYASASNTLSKRTIGSAGQVLTVAGGIPTWAAPTGVTPTPPTQQTLTSGSGTYTTPTGPAPIYLKVTMIGGGGGGGGVSSNITGANGSNGAATSFNSITAGGGGFGCFPTGGSPNGYEGGLGGTGGTGSAFLRVPGNGGAAASGTAGLTLGAGAPGALGGAPQSGGYLNIGTSGAANTGSGGIGGSVAAGYGAGGGGGEFVVFYINSPTTSYSYTVGAGGAGGVSTSNGGAGGSGVIIVEEFYPGVGVSTLVGTGPRTAFPSVAAGTLITATTTNPTYGASVGQNLATYEITTRTNGSKSLEVWWDFSSSGLGFDGVGTMLFNIPSSIGVIDTSLAPASATTSPPAVLSYSIGGLFLATRASGTLFLQGNPFVYSNSQIAMFYSLGFNAPAIWQASSGLFSSGACTMSLHFTVPLV